MATLTQCRAFIDKIAPIAQQCNQERKNKVLPSVCIAQACCESAYGTSPKMIRANAIFGIKVGKSKYHFGDCWNDKAYSTKTKECYDGRTYTSITDMFRAYDTLHESIGDYYDMLGTCKRYKGCLNLTDAKATITAIKNGGYATSPTYVNTIMSIINKFDLTRYDTEVYPTLKVGSKGEYVKIVQEKVGCKVDGDFGQITKNHVIIFQAQNGLDKNGIVDQKTWDKILNK